MLCRAIVRERVWPVEDAAESEGQGAGAGLLDAGFEQVGGLKEEGGGYA